MTGRRVASVSQVDPSEMARQLRAVLDADDGTDTSRAAERMRGRLEGAITALEVVASDDPSSVVESLFGTVTDPTETKP